MQLRFPRISPGLLALALFGLILTVSQSCQNDNEEVILRESTCDTTGVTYTNHVKNIFTQNCTRCHSGPNAEAGYDFSVYANIVALETTSPGLLLGVIEHQPGFQQMPRSAQKLSVCDRSRIRAWIARGMPLE